MTTPIALAGDVGGTRTLLALASRDTAGRLHLDHQIRYESSAYEGLVPIVREYLAQTCASPDRSCFALAGPIVNDRWKATNLSWTLHGTSLAQELRMRVRMLNDFEAAGHGIAELGKNDLVVMQEGRPVPSGPRVLLGAGTGLGEALLFWHSDRYETFPTEGGHADFAAQTDDEWRLCQFLRSRYGHVSYERILSGAGLGALFEFLSQQEDQTVSPEVRAAMQTEDPAAVVTRFGLPGTDTLCQRALALFVAIYGAEAGNLALKAVATGGVFVGGGIAPRIVDKFLDGTFLAAFLDKGRFRSLLETVPVSIITNPNAGLLGAAARALDL